MSIFISRAQIKLTKCHKKAAKWWKRSNMIQSVSAPVCSCYKHKVVHICRFVFSGASWLWNHPVFKSGVQQSCGAGEHLQRAPADDSGIKWTWTAPLLPLIEPVWPSCSSDQQYIHPADAVKLGQAELLVIDEAAAIPLPLVKKLLGPYLVFMASTINGSETVLSDLSDTRIVRKDESGTWNFNSLYISASLQVWRHRTLAFSQADPAAEAAECRESAEPVSREPEHKHSEASCR